MPFAAGLAIAQRQLKQREAKDGQGHDDDKGDHPERRVARMWRANTVMRFQDQNWLTRIKALIKERKARRKKADLPEDWGILHKQYEVRMWYNNQKVQVLVAVLIFGNFLVSATEAHVHRSVTEGSVGEQVFFVFEVFFNVAFALELIVNIYANFFCPFWESAWNIFDFVIVCISLLSMVMKNLPGIGVLRLFRAFRVFRLFKRVKSLRVIIEAVVKSVPGVINAFMILALIMAIWAIMSVEFFGERMEAEFGTFFRAMLTFFQIMTLDGWASGIMRPLMCSDEDTCKSANIMTIFFFLSYVLINAVMMANVVVAILLDKFIAEMDELRTQEQKTKQVEEITKIMDSIKDISDLDAEFLSAAANTLDAALRKAEDLGVDEDEIMQAFDKLEELRMHNTKAEVEAHVDSIDHVTHLPGSVETLHKVLYETICADHKELGDDELAKRQLLRFEAHALQRLREITSELSEARTRLADLAQGMPGSKASGVAAAMSVPLRTVAVAVEDEKAQPPSSLLPPVREALELTSAALPNSATHCVGGG